jgi:CRP-like cAMP-binding protein
MTIDCGECPLRKSGAFSEFSASELAFMRRFKSGELKVDAGTPILLEGSNAPQVYTVLRGMGLRSKLTACGRRQVINFVFPGDFVGLQAGVMGEMAHSVEASTAMTLCVFDRKTLWQIFRDQPERAFDLTWLAAIEEHFLGEALLTLGQRDALQSVAWALHRVFLRGEALGLARDGTMPLPYRQQDLADALGLSLVHTNKTLGRLRDRQLATWSDGVLRLHDRVALADLGMVDDGDAPPKRPLI